MGVENSGHFAGFIPKEPFHPTVFPSEKRVVLAGKKFDGFLAPGIRELGSLSPSRMIGNVTFVAAIDQSVVADVIIQVIVRIGRASGACWVCLFPGMPPTATRHSCT